MEPDDFWPWHQSGIKLTGISKAAMALRTSPELASVRDTDCFAFFDPIVQQGAANYDCIGIADQGRTLWMIARLSNDLEISTRSQIGGVILLTKSIGKPDMPTGRFKAVELSSKAILKDNLLYPLLRAVPGPDGRLILGEGHDIVLGQISTHFKKMAALFKSMEDTALTERDRIRYLEMVFPKFQPEGRFRSPKAAAKRDQDFEECLSSISSGEATMPRSLWAAFLGIAKYIDGQYEPSKPAWLGHTMGSPIKTRALSAAIKLMRPTS